MDVQIDKIAATMHFLGKETLVLFLYVTDCASQRVGGIQSIGAGHRSFS